jgi:hypothetical protein
MLITRSSLEPLSCTASAFFLAAGLATSASCGVERGGGCTVLRDNV